MQHLDEGTIHSWLDGALSADEAARVEAHVKECPQCAAAVAEARGFVAASSRILTALDNAPRGVIPVAAPRRRVDPPVWRIAATVLVVAAGTLVVVRNRGSNEQPSSVSSDSAPLASQPTSVAERVPAAASSPAVTADEAASNGAVSKGAATALSGKAGRRSSGSDVAARENSTLAAAPPAVADQNVLASGIVGAAAPAVTQSRAAAVGAMGMAAESELKVVGTPRRIGAKVTLYEIAPGDTVTLTEAVPVPMQGLVVAVPATVPMARQATGKTAAAPSKARADAAIATAPDSQRAAGVALSAPAISAPAPSQQKMASAVHTITWTDPATGNTLSLTGRMPESRLREIRLRIERERAAAAAKKNP